MIAFSHHQHSMPLRNQINHSKTLLKSGKEMSQPDSMLNEAVSPIKNPIILTTVQNGSLGHILTQQPQNYLEKQNFAVNIQSTGKFNNQKENMQILSSIQGSGSSATDTSFTYNQNTKVQQRTPSMNQRDINIRKSVHRGNGTPKRSQ